MTILLFGHRGQVGTDLQRELTSFGQVVPVTLDLRDHQALTDFLSTQSANVIVNAAAFTRVDDAEINQDACMDINATAPDIMARAAKSMGALFVHYSTDYVFDGSGNTPWTENDPPAPLNIYGQSKLISEQAIAASGCDALVLRCSWIYSPHGQNFIKTILKLAQTRPHLTVIDDQIGAPTSSAFIAKATAIAISQALTNRDLCGLYHLCCAGETSWYGLAAHILDKSGITPTCRITPIPSKDYPQPAKRPHNSRLSTQKLRTHFGIDPPHWAVEVDRLLPDIVAAFKKDQ